MTKFKFKFKAFIFTYNRPEMLAKVYARLREFDIEPTIIDDQSEEQPNYPDVKTHAHRGKRNYWKTWNEVLRSLRHDHSDIYLFMPDDFLDLDIEKIKKLHNQFKDSPYVYNLINDGRPDHCWTKIRKEDYDKESFKIGYTDCGFFCNKKALDEIGYHFKEPRKEWWDIGENISSGVGQQLTMRCNRRNVNIYLPKKSLAYHGDHESKMNPEERKKNPLISK